MQAERIFRDPALEGEGGHGVQSTGRRLGSPGGGVLQPFIMREENGALQ